MHEYGCRGAIRRLIAGIGKRRIILDDGSRVLVRLSGTGTQGATLRVYFESFVPSDGDISQDPQLALDPLIKSIDSLAEISKRTGMSTPTVIT